MNCPFCQILKGEIPFSRVAEARLAMAFLNKNPVNPGHTLVIPRRHVPSFVDLSTEELAAVVSLAQEVGANQKTRLPGCLGITLALSDGEIAGQEVPHCHFHVIPRHTDDGFGWSLPPRKKPDRGELDKVAALLETANDAV